MFQFPANPLVGDIFTPIPGVQYKWNGTGWMPFSTGVITKADADATYIPLTQRGAVNGVATINSTGQVPMGQLSANVPNGLAGLDAAGFVPMNELKHGLANGVADLDATTKVPVAQLPTNSALGVPQLDAGTMVQAMQTGFFASQCRLALSGGNLVLSRHNGLFVFINGRNEAIPSGGVSLAPTGILAATLYYIYARIVGGVMQLFATSTFAPQADPTYGVQVSSGDFGMSLVGMHYALGAGAWSTDTLLTASWFNRKWVSDTKVLTAGVGGLAGATITEISAGLRVNFLSWGDEATQLSMCGDGQGNVGGTTMGGTLRVDGVTTDIGSSWANSGPSYSNNGAASGNLMLARGYHQSSPFNFQFNNTGSWTGLPAPQAAATDLIRTSHTVMANI